MESAFYVLLHIACVSTNTDLCVVQMPGPGPSLTAVDSGLLSALEPGQVSLSLFLSSPDNNTVAGTGVILPSSSFGNFSSSLLICSLSVALEVTT